MTGTILGFSGITPLKSKLLPIIEAFIRQVYLVVVMAWLVGMHIPANRGTLLLNL